MRKIIPLIILTATVVISGCSMKYSFSGASISPDVKTASVIPFANMATMVAPSLAPTFNNDLIQKIQRETRLQIIREGGDVSFEGEIIDYRSDPISISADERAQQNRLTIAIRVKFANLKTPGNGYEKTFSAYEDYDSNQMLSSMESTLIPLIVEKLIQNIFNEAFAQW